MEHRGKHPTKVVVAVARELVGYLWAALTPRPSLAQPTTEEDANCDGREISVTGAESARRD